MIAATSPLFTVRFSPRMISVSVSAIRAWRFSDFKHKTAEDGLRFVRHIGLLIVLADKGFNVVERFEIHDGDELDLIAKRPAQHVDAPKAGDILALDALDNLGLQERLVFIGAVRRGVAVPDAFDHPTLPSAIVYAPSSSGLSRGSTHPLIPIPSTFMR
jgi:hypothetical protein